jgi:hypothetical protein
MGKDIIQDRLMRVLYNEPGLVTCLKDRYVTDEIWMFCIEREPSVFEEMKHPDESICNFAVKIDGNNLKYIKENFTYIPITEHMVYDAVNSCPKAILYVPEEMLKNNTGLKEMAFDKDPALMMYFEDIRPEYIKRKVLENPSYLKYIQNPDEELVCEALKRNPNICVYFDNFTPRMLETLKEYHPGVYEFRERLNNN